MSAHRRLTDEQIAYVQRITTQRRQAMEAVKQFPTNAQLAEELNCCQRVIEKYSCGLTARKPGRRYTDAEIDQFAAELMRK